MNLGYLLTTLAAFWLGSLVAIDLIETPTKFRVLDRNDAVRLGRQVFRKIGVLEVIVAAAMFAVRWAIAPPGPSYWVILALLLLAVLTAMPLRWRLERVVNGLDLVNRDPERAADYEEIRRNHFLFVAADLAKMVLLLILLARAVIR